MYIKKIIFRAFKSIKSFVKINFLRKFCHFRSFCSMQLIFVSLSMTLVCASMKIEFFSIFQNWLIANSAGFCLQTKKMYHEVVREVRDISSLNLQSFYLTFISNSCAPFEIIKLKRESILHALDKRVLPGVVHSVGRNLSHKWKTLFSPLNNIFI